MACVGTLFWLARAGVGQAQQPYASLFVSPFAHYWFLQATFLIMTVFVTVSWAAGGRAGPAAAAIGLAAAVAWTSGVLPPNHVFSSGAAVHLAVFFMAGHLLARRAGRGTHGPGRPTADARSGTAPIGARLAACAVIAATVAAGAALATGLLSLGPEASAARRGAGLLLGLAFCTALFAARPCHGGLAWLGRHSYAVYLFHVFFTAATREAATVAAPGWAPATVWLVTLAAGLAGPVALQHAILRVPGASLPLLGIVQRPRAAAQRGAERPVSAP